MVCLLSNSVVIWFFSFNVSEFISLCLVECDIVIVDRFCGFVVCWGLIGLLFFFWGWCLLGMLALVLVF